MIYSNNLLYSYNDLTIVPAEISNIKSRSECNPFISGTEFDHNGMLPIFASPMATITNEWNIEIWKQNKIMPILPRNIGAAEKIETRIQNVFEFIKRGEWVALSLNEFAYLFATEESEVKLDDKHQESKIHTFELKRGETYRICVDLANGHMKSLYETINKAKALSRERGYNLIIMTGNIANPATYEWICKNAEVDYIRVSIGTGNNCFIDGTKVTMFDGSQKNIEDINTGDKVLTIDGTIQKVENILRFKTNKKLITINKEITSTEDHKFFVINKSDKNIVNETNLEQYGYWIEANKLDKNLHLLVKRYK